VHVHVPGLEGLLVFKGCPLTSAAETDLLINLLSRSIDLTVWKQLDKKQFLKTVNIKRSS